MFDLIDKWCMEIGGVFQFFCGGFFGGINCIIWDMIECGMYWDGGFSYQLDENCDGYIFECEMCNVYFVGFLQFFVQMNNFWCIIFLIGFSLYFNGFVNDIFL